MNATILTNPTTERSFDLQATWSIKMCLGDFLHDIHGCLYNQALVELIIWERVSSWWKESEAVSKFQGACRKGQSLLQETVASALERHSKVFVSYFDVSKAFDTV